MVSQSEGSCESSFSSTPGLIEEGQECIANPYQYCDRPASFGFEKKGKFYPKSDFGMELISYVEAGHLTGYYCNVTHEISGETRRCYFTTAAVHKRIEFITQLNTTFGSGGLICSFTEFDLAQFMQWKRKIFHHNNGVEAKKGILKLGMQPCGKIWVFSDKMFIDVNGLIIVSHHYVWLSRGTRASIMSQKEVSLDDITCSIKEPLSVTPFKQLLLKLNNCLKHNYLSSILLMGGAVMAFHYTSLQEFFGSCPQVMAYGPPATGKTLSLQAALSLFGANNSKHHYNNCSKAFCLLRATASTIPFAIDDFSNLNDLSELIFLFYNGRLSANMANSGSPLLSCPIYCSNFCFKDNNRIASRTLLIPFDSPQVGPVDKASAAAFSDLKTHLDNSSSIVGSVVALSNEIKEDNIKFLCSQVSSVIGTTESRLVLGYAALMFFTNKLLEIALPDVECKDLQQQTWTHFKDVVAPLVLDSSSSTVQAFRITSKEDDNVTNQFVDSILQRCEEMSKEEIEKLVKVLPKHNAKKGKARPSLAVRITQWPFKLPHDKSLLFKEVKDKNTGETNVPTTFKCGKQKAVIVYIDVLDDESRRRVLTRFAPDLMEEQTTEIAPYNVTIMGDNMLTIGDQLELSCTSEGGPHREYKWSRTEDDELSNDMITDTSTLTIAEVKGGDYTCTVTNSAGSSSATLTVYVAPYNVSIMGDNTYNVGDQLELNCSSDGGPDLEYNWSRSDTNKFSDDIATNSSTLIITHINTLDGGDYTCTVSNDAGSSSYSITIYVKPVFTTPLVAQELERRDRKTRTRRNMVVEQCQQTKKKKKLKK